MTRKIASLPPISAEIFDKNVAKAQDEAASTASSNRMPNPGKPKETHPFDTQPPRLATERSYTPTQCLFCTIDSPAVDSNIDHMYSIHGMFIPDRDNLEDAEGFLTYLSNVISDFRECLYCGKTKESVEAIRSHMIDKGHCKIAFGEELDQFYDFDGGSEQSADEEMFREDADHVETDEKASPPPPEHDFHPDSEHELRLPSGRVLGHRSLSRYYRQHLHSYPTPAERADRRAIMAAEAASGENPVLDRPGGQLAVRARGEMGMVGVGEFEKRALRVKEKKDLKVEARARNEYEWRVNKEGNHQQYYRVSLGFFWIHVRLTLRRRLILRDRMVDWFYFTRG